MGTAGVALLGFPSSEAAACRVWVGGKGSQGLLSPPVQGCQKALVAGIVTLVVSLLMCLLPLKVLQRMLTQIFAISGDAFCFIFLSDGSAVVHEKC